MKKTILNIIRQSIWRKALYFSTALMLILGACKKQLDVKNPNNPTFGVNVTDERGLTSYAKGSVYWNGFTYGNGWLGDSYFSLPWGYHELMGDVIGGGQGSNNQTTTMGVPDKLFADPANPSSTTFTNPSPQATAIIRAFNNSDATAQGNNALIYQWRSNYGLINACNLTLENMGNVSLSTDKANTIKAWCYWWKGYAYAQIGSLYYAGLINNVGGKTNDNYVNQSKIIDESNAQLNLAKTTLSAISNQGDYGSVIAQLIPQQCQVGIGAPPTSAEWIRSINTLLARNIVVNRLSPFVNGNPAATISGSSIPAMTAGDWASVITLCNSGLQQNDHVFIGKTSTSNSFFSAESGSVGAMLASSNQVTTYKMSERLVANFKTGDLRRANFTTANGTFFGDANTNTTRWSLIDGVTAGITGVPVLGSREPGGLQIYIGPSYEENQLMLAEAKIRTAAIDAGVAHINTVRSYQGAGVAALPNGLTLTQALTELTMERGAGLAFRALSFYDARRWGWTYAIAKGGGRYGATLIFNTVVYTNATIDYNFMDYWDVPGDETEKNAPAAGSAPVKNPNW
jgi:starch-binding outer membrane protein, SusD/RagB family